MWPLRWFNGMFTLPTHTRIRVFTCTRAWIHLRFKGQHVSGLLSLTRMERVLKASKVVWQSQGRGKKTRTKTGLNLESPPSPNSSTSLRPCSPRALWSWPEGSVLKYGSLHVGPLIWPQQSCPFKATGYKSTPRQRFYSKEQVDMCSQNTQNPDKLGLWHF